MKRREFITLLGITAVAPATVRAQQLAIPVIGFLGTTSEKQTQAQLTGLKRGLSEIGFDEGRNIAFDYRWANGESDRLPSLAAELVRRQVALIVAQAPPAAIAAKAATTSIPIVFVVGFDPVTAGLVTSLSRPGGNATGMTLLSGGLGAKRLGILRELVPKLSNVAMLANAVSPDGAPEIGPVQRTAQSWGLQLSIFSSSTPGEIDTAFAAIAEKKPDALLVGTDAFLLARREDIVTRVARLNIPAIYPFREFTDVGGLISYGTSIVNTYQKAGGYVGRILKGAKPEELPIDQPSNFEMVINLKTAAAFNFDFPPAILAQSNDTIE